MRKLIAVCIALCLLVLSPSPMQAQQPPPSGAAGEVLRSWNSIGKRLIDMAEDFPEDKYDYKPTPEVRSFAEQLLHVAGSNYHFIDTIRGRELGPEDLPREKHRTKADVVAVLKKSLEEGAELIQQAGDEGMGKQVKYPYGNRQMSQYGFWMDPAQHAGEHYGQLVVYYRLNGIVPPASRR